MLDMGFWPSVRRILAYLTAERQNLLVLGDAGLKTSPTSSAGCCTTRRTSRSPIEARPPEGVEQAIIAGEQSHKPELLAGVLARRGAGPRAGLHAHEVRAPTMLETILNAHGPSQVGRRHARGPDAGRSAGRARGLPRRQDGGADPQTDIVARGIDISDISHVNQLRRAREPRGLRPPRRPHGPSSRASGYALTFVGPDEIVQPARDRVHARQNLSIEDLEGFPYRDGRIIRSRPTDDERRSAASSAARSAVLGEGSRRL